MSSESLIRWGGAASTLGGFLYIVGMPGAAEVLPPVGHVAGHALFAAAGLLSLLGLVGLSAHDGGRSGRLGRTGSLLGLLGSTLIFAGNALEALFEHQLAFTGPLYALGWQGLLVGAALLGVTTQRAEVLPRWSARALIIAPLGFFVIFLIAAAILVASGNPNQTATGNVSLTVLNVALGVVFSAPWLILGYVLWSGEAQPARQRLPST